MADWATRLDHIMDYQVKSWFGETVPSVVSNPGVQALMARWVQIKDDRDPTLADFWHDPDEFADSSILFLKSDPDYVYLHHGKALRDRIGFSMQGMALARRVPLGLARTGTAGSHFSGDIFLAFSTADVPGLASAFPVGPVGDDEFGTLTFVPWGRMDDLYTAVVQSIEEAVLNALVVNDDMVGRDGHRSPALPHARLKTLLDQH